MFEGDEEPRVRVRQLSSFLRVAPPPRPRVHRLHVALGEVEAPSPESVGELIDDVPARGRRGVVRCVGADDEGDDVARCVGGGDEVPRRRVPRALRGSPFPSSRVPRLLRAPSTPHQMTMSVGEVRCADFPDSISRPASTAHRLDPWLLFAYLANSVYNSVYFPSR